MWQSPRTQFVLALGISSLVSVALFAFGSFRNHSFQYAYLVWNLFLAWLPLVFAVWLHSTLRRKLWSSWEALSASFLWLVFLPNSFYMISDFIHLQDVQTVDVLFDALMFTSFIFTGVLAGFTSLYTVHQDFKKRLSRPSSNLLIAAILFVCSFAIYVGRDLRWNSWDILTNPGGLLFDVSDRLTHPSAYPEMTLTVIGFFVVLTSMYGLAWRSVQLIRGSRG